MDCPLKDQQPQPECRIITSISVLAGIEQVQDTCATCGAGCGYTRTEEPADEEPVSG